MKFCVIIFSLFLTVIHCDLPLVSEITELTNLDTVINTAINLSSKHTLNVANSFVRKRQDFGIEYWIEMVNHFNTRSLAIRKAIETDSQQVLAFYASNQLLHDAAQRLVNTLLNTIETVTNALLLKLREKDSVAIRAGDYIFNDVEENLKRLNPILTTGNRGCATDLTKFFRSMGSGSSTCGKNAGLTGETLYFDWGFKLADIHQDFIETTNPEALRLLTNEEVLARFSEFEAEIVSDLEKFRRFGIQFIENAYNEYMRCMGRIFISSRTSEGSLRSKLKCLNLSNILGNTLGILGNKRLLK